MSKKKLTLSVEEHLSKRAKAIAEERGTSVSRLVEAFFSALEGDVEWDDSVGGRAGEQETDSDPSRELSDWARRWRGAFREPGRSYPDDPSWEKQVLAEEIEEKHA